MEDLRPLKEDEVECSKCGAIYVPDFKRDYYGGENGRGGKCESCFMSELSVQQKPLPNPVAVTDEKRLNDVCRLKKGRETCRYLAMHPDLGMACAKGSNLQSAIDQRVSGMRAQGDNCSGPPDFLKS